jgi:hypothetical protein
VLKVAARKDDDDDEDDVPNGGMVLDLTAELGGLVREAPPIAEINNTSTESQATNQAASTSSQQCRNSSVPQHKPNT